MLRRFKDNYSIIGLDGHASWIPKSWIENTSSCKGGFGLRNFETIPSSGCQCQLFLALKNIFALGVGALPWVWPSQETSSKKGMPYFAQSAHPPSEHQKNCGLEIAALTNLMGRLPAQILPKNQARARVRSS